MYGEELKKTRVFYGYKVKELATKIGTSHQNIKRWETNENTPSIDFCVKLADFYGITLDELIGRTVKKNW